MMCFIFNNPEQSLIPSGGEENHNVNEGKEGTKQVADTDAMKHAIIN